MDIFTYEKSLEERLAEMQGILSRRGQIVPSSQIHAEWSYHVELVIEPIGWRALWKIPRFTCQDFNVHYPTIVLVEVENVHFKELTALAKIIGVQDDSIHLPEKYDVPLVEMYPTTQQPDNAINIFTTANCIDRLRFFFDYLFMPWDIDDDDNADWVEKHLEARLHLFFDMKNGAVSKETCDVVRSLRRESREIKAKIDRLEEDFSDSEEENDTTVMDTEKVCKLMKYHLRLEQIKREMEVLENPEMRDVLVKSQFCSSNVDEIKRRESRGRQAEACFVWLGASVEETIEALNKARAYLSPTTFLKTVSSLKDALNTSEAGDIVILGEGMHQIKGIGGLENGGLLRGIGNSGFTTIAPQEATTAPSLLDFSGENVVIENVSIDLGELQAGIIVRKGTVQIINSKVYASNQSIVKMGIIVLPGAKLIAKGVKFEGLGTSVSIYSNAEGTIEECSFEACTEGVQMYDDAKLKAKKCSFSNFKEFGIRWDTEKHLDLVDQVKSGDLKGLEELKQILLEQCNFEMNGRGNITVCPKSGVALSIKHVEDNVII